MSLIVAKVIDETVRLLSDTKITDPRIFRDRLVRGTIKTVIIDPSLCVAFAGSVEPALAAIREVTNLFPSEDRIDQILSRLHGTHQECRQETDFLVATAGPPVSLHRIVGGQLQRGLTEAWIGDFSAFNAYQNHYHSEQIMKRNQTNDDFRQAVAGLPFSVEALDTYLRMHDAFRAVIADPSIESVDHLLLTATSRSSSLSGFHFLPGMVGHDFQPVVNTTQETSLLRPIEAAGGGFNYTILVPVEAGIGAVGVYFLQGSLGTLLFPTRFDGPRLYREASCEEFITRVTSDFGFQLDGFRFA